MGRDLEVAIADWERLTGILDRVGIEGLRDLFAAQRDEFDEYIEKSYGFNWGPNETAPWYGDYRFARGTNSAKPHHGLAKLWEDLCDRDDIPADLIAQIDPFLGRLLRWRIDDDLVAPSGWPADKTRGINTACSPDEVADLARRWPSCAARLEELRPAATAEIAEWANYSNFDDWVDILKEWSQIVREADRRNWGLFVLIE
ncbi:hypothetical protein [Nocardia sp. NPDC004722]